jgi:hypothetical protein
MHMQQWYGDVSFSGFGFDYSGMAGASSSHPPPFESPPLAQTHDDDEENEESGEEEEDDEWSLQKAIHNLFWVLDNKGAEKWLKCQGLLILSFCFVWKN